MRGNFDLDQYLNLKMFHFFSKVIGGAIDTVSDIFGDDVREGDVEYGDYVPEKEDANAIPLKAENPKV